MRYLFSYVFFLCNCFYAAAQTHQQTVQLLNEETLPGKPSCLLFSKNGFFYAGTSQGLFLFNGINVKALTSKKDSLQNITCLFETSTGVLWIGCSNGSIYTYTGNRLQEWKPQEGHPEKGISAIKEDSNKQLWFATKGEGLYVLSNGKLNNINHADGLSDDYVYDLLFINNKMITATDGGISICSFTKQKKSIQVFNTAHGLADNIVQTIAADLHNNNKIWLGFQNGNAGTFDLKTNQYEQVYQIKSKEASVVKILPLDDEVWMGDEGGIAKLKRRSNALDNNSTEGQLIDMAIDAESNIWILSSSGLYRSPGEKLERLFAIDTVAANAINDITVTADGCVWLTAKGSIICYKPGTNGYSTKILPLSLHSKTEITCLYADGNETIWIGTMGEGLFTCNTTTQQITKFNKTPGLVNASILSITEKNQHIWINSLEGVWKYDDASQQMQSISTNVSTGSAYIYYVMEDSKGRVWFATDGKGIAVWQNGAFTTFREKEGVTAKVIYAIAEDKYGGIWFNTLNNGLFKYNGSSFIHFGKEQGLPDLNISSITADANGNVFCVATKECFLVNASTYNIVPVVSAAEAGMMNTGLNSSYTNGPQSWFHAGNYVYTLKHTTYKTVTAPVTKIMSMQLFLNETDTTLHIFDYNENNLSFSFTGFYFSDPSRVSYQYKLEGYNNEWQSTKDGYVNFPKLQPGTYTFRVRSSVTGNFNNASEASYVFTIKKPFWRTWWFLLLSIASVTAILISIIKAREAEVQKIQQLKTEKLKSQYETLKNQVNPHFLFNSFNTLLNVIDEDPNKAAVYVEHLSDFYRSIVNMRDKDVIPLADEIRIIEHYFFIQKKRFGNALQFVNEVTEQEAAAYSIPPLTLQLLAENAVKHNAISKDKPLTLRLSISNNQLQVQNNINEKLNAEKGEGLGLQNIKNRFLLIAGKEVTIENTDNTFIVSLPLIKVL
jgi:ligand-binding sensor domain-containing protein